jgi:predicted Fe-Mo cluster-binding NifX family protein
MRLLIPTVDDRGPRSLLSDHFGRAPYFAIAETASGDVRTMANGAADHGSGGCAPVDLLEGDGRVDAVVCRGIGRRALAQLNSLGIAVYIADGPDVATVLDDHRSGRIGAASADRRHAAGADGCGGGGCGDHHD